MITGREHDDAVPDVPCDAIREVRMPTSEVLDAAADFSAASSPDAAAAAKLSSTPAAAIFAGDEAGMGAPGCWLLLRSHKTRITNVTAFVAWITVHLVTRDVCVHRGLAFGALMPALRWHSLAASGTYPF